MPTNSWQYERAHHGMVYGREAEDVPRCCRLHNSRDSCQVAAQQANSAPFMPSCLPHAPPMCSTLFCPLMLETGSCWLYAQVGWPSSMLA